ncbi:MAG: hypothetical protein M3Z25_00505 [Actinomycetota bacterium]|nr:hypothetical protein [Actinomycetota bacterium]
MKDFVDNSGVWDVKVFVGKTLFDWKKAKPYNPHGSIRQATRPVALS